jgi:NADH-quinone oxidoreductase subunit L
MLQLVWLIPALPLAGFLALSAFGRRLGDPLAGWVATVMVAASFGVSCIVFAGLVDRPGDDRFFTQTLFSWIPVGGLRLQSGFLVVPPAKAKLEFDTSLAPVYHL